MLGLDELRLSLRCMYMKSSWLFNLVNACTWMLYGSFADTHSCASIEEEALHPQLH